MDSWFSEQFSHGFGWLALLSFLGFLGPYAQRGKHRRWVMGVWLVVLAFGCVCLVGAVAAAFVGQPAYVVRPLGVSGVVITVIFAGFYRTLRRAYRDAELRRMTARDI